MPVVSQPFLIVGGVNDFRQATLKSLRNCLLPTETPVSLIKLSTVVFQWYFKDLNTDRSSGCVHWLKWLGSSTTMMSFSFARSRNSTLLWDPCRSQIVSWGRDGSMVFKKYLWTRVWQLRLSSNQNQKQRNLHLWLMIIAATSILQLSSFLFVFPGNTKWGYRKRPPAFAHAMTVMSLQEDEVYPCKVLIPFLAITLVG